MKLKLLLPALAFLGAAIVSPFSMAANQQGNLTPAQVNQVEKIIHSYIVKNPQILVEASEALQKQQMAKIEDKAKSAISKNAKEIFSGAGSPVLGNMQGKVSLVEFFDYQCGHCKRMAPVVENLMKQDKNLRIVFKELPIFGGNSRFAAEAALASLKQGKEKYLAFHNALMKAANPLTPVKIEEIGKKVGLDWAKVTKGMKSPEVQNQLEENFKLATELGIQGTPSFVIGNRSGSNSTFVPGAAPEATLQGLIQKAGS